MKDKRATLASRISKKSTKTRSNCCSECTLAFPVKALTIIYKNFFFFKEENGNRTHNVLYGYTNKLSSIHYAFFFLFFVSLKDSAQMSSNTPRQINKCFAPSLVPRAKLVHAETISGRTCRRIGCESERVWERWRARERRRRRERENI